jgi:hypothetical protein
VKGAGEMLGYPISTPSKSASSGVGLGSLEVGQDGTNSTSFSPPWYNAILKMLPLNRHTIYFNTWKQTFNPKNIYIKSISKHKKINREILY